MTQTEQLIIEAQIRSLQQQKAALEQQITQLKRIKEQQGSK